MVALCSFGRLRQAAGAGRQVGICGRALSDYPEFAAFLVAAGIDSIFLNPDSVIKIKQIVAEAKNKQS